MADDVELTARHIDARGGLVSGNTIASALARGLERAAHIATTITPSSTSAIGEAHMRTYRDAIVHAIRSEAAALRNLANQGKGNG